jgi:DUF4097 and DUF4098 domain-containing protein YvlB
MKAFAILLMLVPLAADAGTRVVRHSMGGDIVVASAPDGASVSTMGGDIRLGNVAGEVVARTMGGNVRAARVEGSIRASTMGGNVRLDIAGGGSGRSIEASSMGGAIDVSLPSGFGADFEVELSQWEDGPMHTIRSDFPLQIRESTRWRWFRHVRVLTATGRIGAGGNLVRIETNGGDITIHQK